MGASTVLKNYINGAWCASSATTHLKVINPATTDVLATVPLSSASEVDQAAQAAQAAFVSWRRTPATERIQYLFKLKTLLEEQLER
jgi:malonate-semialdehyde dehydrogenase (acetylating)/methylmalonate-semialdehyde dehydrogenase